MKKKYIKTNRNTKDIDYFILFIILICIFVGIFFIIIGFSNRNNENLIYRYTAEKSADYNVILKPNDFYVEKEIQAGKYYASLSVDYYVINFLYLFNGIR